MTITTTLAEIRSHNPCASGFAKIRGHFGVSPDGAKTHDQPFPVALLLKTNGLDDALWVTAHVAPDAITRFLIRRLDTGDYSALGTLRGLDGDFALQIEAIETVVTLLRRKLAGEDVVKELQADSGAASGAARAAYAASADRAAAHAAHAARAGDAVYAAAHAAYAAYAARAVYAAAHAAHATRNAVYAAAHATYATSGAARADLIAALEGA